MKAFEHQKYARENKEKWNREIFEELSEFEKNIHNKAFLCNTGDPDYHSLETLKYNDNGTEREMQVPKGDVLYQIRKEVDEGKLKDISCDVELVILSEHTVSTRYV